MRILAAPMAAAVLATMPPAEAASPEGSTEMVQRVRREARNVWLDGVRLHAVRCNQLGNLQAIREILQHSKD